MTSSPFSAAPIELAAAGGVPARLLPLDQRSCASLASGIVAMEPWSVMNYPADKLAAFLARPDAGAARYVVSVRGAEAGVVIRSAKAYSALSSGGGASGSMSGMSFTSASGE